MRHSLLLLAALAGVIALTGCSGAPTGGSSGGVTPGGSSASPDTSADSSQPSATDGPLYPYRALINGDGLPPDASEQEQNQHYVQQQSQIEELIATCMTKQGFQYIPGVQAGDVIQPGEDNWRPDDRSWVSRYGYGLLDYPGRVPPNQEVEKKDPQEEYLASMTEAEQEAYQQALNGSTSAEDQDDWTRHACRGAAEHEVIGYQPSQDASNRPIIQAIQEFYAVGLRSDPAFAPLDTEWARCMADHDYPGFKAQTEAPQSIDELLNGYFPADDGSADKNGRTKDPTFATLDDPAYAAIAEQEVALALADLDCREQTHYRQRHLDLQFELEARFVEDHREELQALKHRVEQAGK